MTLRCRVWLLFWAGLFLFQIVQGLTMLSLSENPPALDFRMRYNEAECVRAGRDPYLVWNGTLPAGKYTPWDFKYLKSAEGLNLVHAYPPWEYSWMLPLTCFKRNTAEGLFRCLSLCGILCLAGSAFFLGYTTRREAWAGFAAASVVLLEGCAMQICMDRLNYGVLIAAAALMALFCHRQQHDWLAGLFWSFTLVKPQLGGLFMVTLLVRWKWRTLLVAGCVTLVGTLIPAFLCHRSPVEMVLAIASYSRGQFFCTGFIPCNLFSSLEPVFGASALMAVSAVIGLLLCVILSWMLRHCEDVFECAMPPVLLSTLWVASRAHDQCINAVMLMGLALSALKAADVRHLVLDVSLALLLVSRGLDDVLSIPINMTQVLAVILLFVRVIQLRDRLRENCGKVSDVASIRSGC